MDILVFSDSHGHPERIAEVLARPGVSPSAVFFLGDGLRDLAWLDFKGAPLYRVCGNCDFFAADGTESELFTELGGVKIFAAHGHRYSVKSTETHIAAHAAALGADIVLFGHTHTPLERTFSAGTELGGVTLTRDLHMLNPGSIGSGDASFGQITLHNGRILTSFRYLYK